MRAGTEFGRCGLLDLRIHLATDAALDVFDTAIFQAVFIVADAERETFASRWCKHRGERRAVRQAHLRRLNIDGARNSETAKNDRRNANIEIPDCLGINVMLAASRNYTFDGRLHACAAGVAFHRHIAYQVVVAKCVGDDVGCKGIGVSAGKSIRAFEDISRPGKTLSRQECGGNARLGRAGGMNTFDRGARLIELRQSAGERGDETNTLGNSAPAIPLVGKKQTRCGDRRAETATCRGALKTPAKMRRLNRQSDADHCFVAGGNRGEKFATARIRTHGERGRKHDCAGMQPLSDMGIIGIDTAGIHGIEEAGAYWVHSVVPKQHRC